MGARFGDGRRGVSHIPSIGRYALCLRVRGGVGGSSGSAWWFRRWIGGMCGFWVLQWWRGSGVNVRSLGHDSLTDLELAQVELDW